MNAREYALDIISKAGLPGWSRTNTKLPKSKVDDARDRGLGESIAANVVRNQLLLRHLIKHYSGRQIKSVDPLVQMIVAIGLAQLRFFDRIPESAAVDEAVEQVKRLKLGRASGFVNAVLRQATRDPNPALPTREDPALYAQLVLSVPPELFHKLAEILGTEKALKLCEKNNREAPTIVRTDDLSKLSSEHLQITPHKQAGFAVVENATESDFAKWSAEGLAQVQDPTSALVVNSMELEAGIRVLDRCCGVGTKTLQIAHIVGSEGLVVAVDPSKPRIARLNETLKKRDITGVKTCVAGMMSEVEIDQPFDRVLIDAPCSNSGVLMRRPEARYRQDEKSLKSLLELQRRILLDTIPHVRKSGIVVYSTCSIWPEENGGQLQWLAAQGDTFEVVSVKTTMPSVEEDPTRHHDGGFVAVLRIK